MCQTSPLEKIHTSILDKFNTTNSAQAQSRKYKFSQAVKSAVQSMTGNIKFVDPRGGERHE